MKKKGMTIGQQLKEERQARLQGLLLQKSKTSLSVPQTHSTAQPTQIAYGEITEPGPITYNTNPENALTTGDLQDLAKIQRDNAMLVHQMQGEPETKIMAALMESNQEMGTKLAEELSQRFEDGNPTPEQNTEALLFNVKQILDMRQEDAIQSNATHLKTTFSEKVEKARVQSCSFFIGKAKESQFNPKKKILSWCMLDPISGTCDKTICFDVEEVQAWIKVYTDLNEDVPMIHHAEVSRLLGNKFDIPKKMSVYFKTVVDNYVAADFAADARPNGLQEKVLDAIQNWLVNDTTNSKEIVAQSLFWRVTKMTAKMTAKITFQMARFLLTSQPFWIVYATTILRLTRIIICVYTTMPKFSDSLLETIRSMLFRTVDSLATIPRFLWDSFENLWRCTTAFVEGGVFSGIWTCLKTVFNLFGGAFHSLGKFVESAMEGLFLSIGFTGVAFWTREIDVNPLGFLNYLLGGKNTRLLMNLKEILYRQNADAMLVTASLTVLSIIPQGVIISVASMVITALFPAAAPFITFLEKYGIILCIQAMFQFFTQKRNAVFAFINELLIWIKDIFGCVVLKLASIIKQYIEFAFGIKVDDNLETTPFSCCMDQVVNEIRAATTFSENLSLTEKVREGFDYVAGKMSASMNYITNWFGGTLTNAAEASTFTMEEEEKSARYHYQHLPVINEYSRCTSCKTTTEHRQIISSSASQLRKIWATPCDKKHKSKVSKTPILTMFVDGQTVHFHTFQWKEESVFNNGLKFHVSVLPEEIQDTFPKAIQTVNGMTFVLMEHLPLPIQEYMSRVRSPVFDLTPFLPQQLKKN